MLSPVTTLAFLATSLIAAPTAAGVTYPSVPSSTVFGTLMQFSVAAYCPSTVNSKKIWACGKRCGGAVAGTTLTATLADPKTHAAGYVGFNTAQKRIVAIFRGTESIQSALIDLQFIQTAPDSDCSFISDKIPSEAKIHFGFGQAYRVLQSTIMPAVEALAAKYPDYEISFGGHSLGGALAAIAATDFVTSNPGLASRVNIYTFGEPRSGNAAWANFIQNLFSTHYRVVAQGDPVPHLPPQFLKYNHGGQQVKVKKDTQTSICPTSGPAGESSVCLKSDEATLIFTALEHIIGYFNWTTYPAPC